nr:hypothetical protein [Tanacetum cinerariifolium]
MGDENPIRTLGDYSRPSHEGYRNTIELLERNNMVPLRSDTIRLGFAAVLAVLKPERLKVDKARNKMSRDVITVGSTMRILLLYRGEYSQWRERFMNCLEEQIDGEAMINSIQNGDQPLPVIAQVLMFLNDRIFYLKYQVRSSQQWHLYSSVGGSFLTSSGNFFWQWELFTDSGNALCILFPTILS